MSVILSRPCPLGRLPLSIAQGGGRGRARAREGKGPGAGIPGGAGWWAATAAYRPMAASIALRQEEDKGVEVQLLLFESLGGFGKGVREILWKAANLRAAEQADAGPYDSQHNNLITAVMDSAKTEFDPCGNLTPLSPARSAACSNSASSRSIRVGADPERSAGHQQNAESSNIHPSIAFYNKLPRTTLARDWRARRALTTKKCEQPAHRLVVVKKPADT